MLFNHHPKIFILLLFYILTTSWNGSIFITTTNAFLINTIPVVKQQPSSALVFLNAKSTKKVTSGKKGFGNDNNTNKSPRGFGKNTIVVPKKSSTVTRTTSSKNIKAKASPYIKSDQEQLLQSLLQSSSESVLGKVITTLQKETIYNNLQIDPFYEMLPSLIQSKFPNASSQEELSRVAGFLHHTILHNDMNYQKESLTLLEDDVIQNPYRDNENIHAYMPGLGPTQTFYDEAETLFPFVQELQDNYPIIKQEFLILSEKHEDKFQSVTEMNYESGWNTLLLFYNGHAIDDFPYDVCPVTTSIIKKIPLGGRIVGFNRQRPKSGIPKHTDGNNMWLTCQLGVQVPKDQAYIKVGSTTNYYQEGKCLLYDTTYEHETFNTSPDEDRIVLHVDFYNNLKMTQLEIDIMQYIYSMREKYLQAEGGDNNLL